MRPYKEFAHDSGVWVVLGQHPGPLPEATEDGRVACLKGCSTIPARDVATLYAKLLVDHFFDFHKAGRRATTC